MRARLLLLSAILVGASCNSVCECPLGTICTDSGECLPECAGDNDCVAPTCGPEADPCCSSRVACVQNRCVVPSVTEDMCGAPPVIPEGWDDPPGHGPVFIVNHIGIAANAEVDVDGRCGPSGCLDNALARLGELTNDQLRQGLLGGENLHAIELAGLDADYRGFDRSLTVKIYEVFDADDPFFPANNFRAPPGHTDCCEFLVDPIALDGSGVASKRLPAQIRDGLLFTVGEPRALDLHSRFGLPPFPTLELALPQVQLRLPDSLERVDEVLLSGALTARSLASVDNPYCRTASPRCPGLLEGSTLIDLASSTSGQPDIDVDADGIECLYDADGDGSLEACCEGAQLARCPTEVCEAPILTSESNHCTQSLSDGHSVSFELAGVAATFVGVGQRD